MTPADFLGVAAVLGLVFLSMALVAALWVMIVALAEEGKSSDE